MKIMTTCKLLNLLGLLFLCIVLGITLYLEIVLSQKACPLCLLQRLGMIGIGIGFMMNLRFGESSKFYALALFGALFGASVATRQILMHITPGSGAFGEPIFGLHLYTWSFLIFAGMILYIIFLLALTQTETTRGKHEHHVN